MASTKKKAQALAIKLSRERRSGKEIPPPPKGRYPEKSRKKAIRDLEVGRAKRAKRKRDARGSSRRTAERGLR